MFVCRNFDTVLMETGKLCDNIRVTKNGLVSSVDRMFKSSDSAFKHITDRLNPLRKSAEFDILSLRRFACIHDNVEVLVPWKWDMFSIFHSPCVKDLVVCHFVRYWDYLSLYGHMEHKETQSQSRRVRGSEKDFGSRFAVDLFCSWKFR